jgi:branched-chain amino acid transport system permease protein
MASETGKTVPQQPEPDVAVAPSRYEVTVPRKVPSWVLLLFVLAVLAGLTLFGVVSTKTGTISLLATTFMYAAMAQGWNMLGGYAGYLNFGIVAFFGAGAYTVAIVNTDLGWSPWLAMPLGGLVALVIGAVIGVPSLRLRGAYFAILTLLITFVMQLLVVNVDFTQGARGIFIDGLGLEPDATARTFYFLFLGLAVLVSLIVFLAQRSRFGSALVAIREDEDAAEVLGVRTTWAKMVALMFGCAVAGVAGGIYAIQILYLEPAGAFALHISLNVVVIAVIGGSGFWQGPLIGAPLFIFLEQELQTLELPLLGGGTTEVPRLVFGLILVFVVLLAPRGIMGLIHRLLGRRTGKSLGA